MNTVTYNFTYTTAEEQSSYFSGEIQNKNIVESDEGFFSPGMYRIINGKLSRIISGASPDIIKMHFDTIAKQNID